MRNPVFDIMKGIGIVLMIIGHGAIPRILRTFIFSFHMPLFFILGGMFYSCNKDLPTIIRSSSRRLLIPYLITGLTTVFILYVFGIDDVAYDRLWGILFGPNGSRIALIQTPHVGAVWFLLALFWCRLFFDFIYRSFNHWLIISISLSFIAALIGRYLVNPPFGILIGVTALSFYSLGVYLKNMKYSKRIIFVLFCCWLICILFSRLEMATYLYKIYPLDVAGALGGTFFVYRMAQFIKFNSGKISSFVEFLGSNSLLILCYHQIVTYLFICIEQTSSFFNPYLLICYNLVFTICLVYFHNKISVIVKNVLK